MLSANQCTHVSWGHDLLNCMLDFVSRLKYVSIDNTEFCILNAIVLTYPGMSGSAFNWIKINLVSLRIQGHQRRRFTSSTAQTLERARATCPESFVSSLNLKEFENFLFKSSMPPDIHLKDICFIVDTNMLNESLILHLNEWMMYLLSVFLSYFSLVWIICVDS